MSLVKDRIDPNDIFFINEKNDKAVYNNIECKTCGNLIYTLDNYPSYNGLIKDCPFCSGYFTPSDK